MFTQNDYQDLIEIVRKNTYPSNSSQELAPEIVSSLKEKGYFSLLLPDYLGGAQLDYPQYIDLVFNFPL